MQVRGLLAPRPVRRGAGGEPKCYALGMSETTVRRRRSRGEDAVCFAADKNRYVGSVSLSYGPEGKRIRRKVLGKTKQEVRDRLKALHEEMDAGVKSSKT